MLVVGQSNDIFFATPSEYRKESQRLLDEGFEEVGQPIVTFSGIYSVFRTPKDRIRWDFRKGIAE